MKLPKLYSPVKIKFSSLRNGIGDGGGVMFDIDTLVTRTVVRVLSEGGWKWQIANLYKIIEWDYFVAVDQESLNEIGMDASCICFVTAQSKRPRIGL